MGLTGIEEHFERYAKLAAVTPDWERIRNYRIVVAVRMIVSCSARSNAGPANTNAAIYFNLPVMLNAQAVSLLATYEGVGLPAVDLLSERR